MAFSPEQASKKHVIEVLEKLSSKEMYGNRIFLLTIKDCQMVCRLKTYNKLRGKISYNVVRNLHEAEAFVEDIISVELLVH